MSSYPDDLELSLESDFVQMSRLFASSPDLQDSTCSKQSMFVELRMYKFFMNRFSNTEIALRIYLSMMVSSPGGECSFLQVKTN